MGYGNRMRVMELVFTDGEIKRVRYTKSAYWSAAGNPLIKLYRVLK